MRRFLRFFLISLVSLLMVVLITISILFWFVFTPEKLTPAVIRQSEKHIPYPAEIGEVELTFFSTFPQIGLRVSNFTVISPLTGAPCDTLLKAGEITGMIDAKAFRKNRDLIINRLIISDSYLNLFTDSLGQTNYGLLLDEFTTDTEDPSGMEFGIIDLENLELKNLNLIYTDHAFNLNTTFSGLAAKISGVVRGDNFSGHLDVGNSVVSVEYEGEKYLDNARIQLSAPAEIIFSRMLVDLKDGLASVNGMGFSINGSIEYDIIRESVITDISYQLERGQIGDLMALIPPSFLSGFGEIDASGIISSRGIVRGSLNDSLMPLMDIRMTVADGNLSYGDLPFPLSGMNGEIHFYSDPENNPLSFMHISHFEAGTPGSEFRTRGRVSNLFGDMHYDLVSEADVLLDEFRTFIPEDMNLEIGGRVSGQVRADFTMSQAENMELDKMKLAGSALLSGFSMVYDTIFLSSNDTRIDFALPNPRSSGVKTGFAFVRIESGELTASVAEEFSTSMSDARFFAEMSDVRDTTIIPDLFCTFNIGSLRAGMDTVSIAADNPLGYFTLSPLPEAPGRPAIGLALNSTGLIADMGQNSAVAGNFSIKTDIVNDKAQEDVFLQWLPKGFLEVYNGTVSLQVIPDPMEISAIRMDFDPETFNISESSMKIGRSDFSLTGVLDNVFSYFRGDSLLRGEFSFVSGNTDLMQIMNLTSGIGSEDEDAGGELPEPEDPEQNPQQDQQPQYENSFAGPYMVPQGIDILLMADIQQATFGADTATNITGDVRVSDGILVLDGLTFTTPAAEMQLTAMYRTPRKNHLYLGINYHMLDVEISRLLKMIPDIDTLMPMLRSFEGTGEFHIAVETYLDSLYNIKKSTLRGASSIRGQDLVLMDGETFSEIAKNLRFSKKAENRVDSLSAEFTIFREEIDIYPFLIVMDRYKAVVAGRHNFDMSFNYHISLVESPLPIRLGIDITGTLEDLQYRLARARYAEFYRPASRRAVESRQLELRRMIREALIRNIRD